MEKVKYSFLLLVTLLGSLGYAAEVPHLQDVLSTQFKCNLGEFNKFKWKKDYLLSHLSAQGVGVVTKPVITETAPSPKPYKNRRFEVSFTGFATFFCKEAHHSLFPEEVLGVRKRAAWIISDQGDSIGIGESQEFPTPEEAATHPRFLHDEDSSLICLVDIKDLISNPDLISVDRLCKGESKKAKDATRKFILDSIASWRAAGVAK